MSFYRIALCIVVVFAAVIAVCEFSLIHKARGGQEADVVRGGFVWTSNPKIEIRVLLDLPPDVDAYKRGQYRGSKIFVDYHVHCPEEMNGGGYRGGKYVYLKDL